MIHLQPVTEKNFSQKGEPLKSFYWRDGKLFAVTVQSGGTGRPHDPHYRKPLIVGAVPGTNPVDAVDVTKGDKLVIHYHALNGKHCRLEYSV